MQRTGDADHLMTMNVVDDATTPLERLRTAAETYDLRFEELRPYLVGVCRSLAGDDAEDVAQDTYLIGRRRLGQLREPRLLRSWLTTIAINECFGRHRRRQRLQALLASLMPVTAGQSDPDLRSRVEALPFRDRTVVVLHYGHGLSLEEIATLLHAKPTTIRSVLFRARKRLRAELGDPATTKEIAHD
jgi:RNA polymerase sigma-70 factor (ECF subfamily)